LVLGRAFAWFGRGIRGPLRDAMLAESVVDKDCGKAFGFHRAGDTLGAIIGPLLGALFLFLLEPLAGQDVSHPFRVIFLLTLIPGLGSALAFAWLVREKIRPANHQLKFWASLAVLPSSFRRYLVGVGVFGAGDFAPALLILAATQLLAPEYGGVHAAQIAALMYTLRNVTYAAACYPLGAISDRIGRRTLLWSGYLLGGLVMIGFAGLFWFAASAMVILLVLLVLFALAGAFIAAEDALEGAMTADLVPDLSVRGMAYGVLGTVNGFGDLISSILVGALWAIDPTLGFAYAAFMMLMGAFLLNRVR
jgi:MFS family permease